MRIIGAIAAGTVGIALLTGCGTPAPVPSSPATPPPTSAPAPAPSPTATDTAPSGGAEISVDDFLQRVSGAEMKTYTMEMEMSTSIEGTPMAIRTSGTFDNSDSSNPRSHMKMEVSGMEMEIILVDGDAFLKMAVLGDTWMKMDPEDAAEMAGTSGPDIGQWTEDYAKNVEKVERVGEESLNGVAVTHYRLTLKPEALGDLGMEEAGIEATDVVFDVWIDGDGFTRQFVMDMKGDVPVAMTATLDNFNQPVTIEAPKDWTEMPK